MNLLIALALMMLALVLGLVFLLRVDTTSSVRFGPTDVDESLGEYGRLKAQLDDLNNPYSGRPLFDGWIGRAITFGALGMCVFAFYWVRDRSTAAIALLVATVSMLFVAFLLSWLLTTVKRRAVIRQMAQWRKNHPNIQINGESGRNDGVRGDFVLTRQRGVRKGHRNASPK